MSALRYEGVARAVILDFKERGRTDLASPLALALLAAIELAAMNSGTSVEVVAVPSHRSAVRKRGYRPVELLMRKCGLRPAKVLVVAEVTSQQKLLNRAGREKNLRGSLRARGHLRGRCFVVVDDVVTSGATLAEAARAIRAAGGVVVSAATVAFTPQRVPEHTNF